MGKFGDGNFAENKAQEFMTKKYISKLQKMLVDCFRCSTIIGKEKNSKQKLKIRDYTKKSKICAVSCVERNFIAIYY